MEFLLGLGSGVLIMLATSFFREAGKDGYQYLKSRYFPGKPPPKLVDRHFVPEECEGQNLHWVGEEKFYSFESKGFRVYESEKGVTFYYINNSGGKEFLMIRDA